MPTVRSVCCYCGTGCGVRIEHDGDRILRVDGDPDHPASFGRLCSKGSTLHLARPLTTRALHPELRAGRNEPRRRVSWDAALDHAADRLAGIVDAHGPDTVAFYVSGQLLTEDYYVFNKLARAVVGTNNIDSNSRLCMSSAVSAYKRTLGSDAPPACYEDLERADCVLIAGSNTAYAHPIVFRRLLDARAANPERKLIVVDPRATDTAAAADLHLQIEPGTDAILLGAMLHVLIWDGLVDRRFVAAHT
ncbi:MAG TPA: molybdopterin-dependent oxidoreductase, partial [Burkholderiaceae bacterium]